MVWQLLGYSMIPMTIMGMTGAAAAWREPGPRLRSAVLHLAAGVIFAVVAVEFLPDLMREHAGTQTAIGFVVGTIAMLGFRSLSRRAEEKAQRLETERRSLPLVLLFATGVDLAIDGLMLGIAFTAGRKEGVMLTLALAIELGSVGLAIAAALQDRGIQRGRAVLVVCGLALLFGFTASAGGLILPGLSGDAWATLLAFGSAALLFLVTEELLTEAHEIPENPLLTAAFFLGFITLFLIDMLNG